MTRDEIKRRNRIIRDRLRSAEKELHKLYDNIFDISNSFGVSPDIVKTKLLKIGQSLHDIHGNLHYLIGD